jgi:DNA-binding response OmpR family regulator
MPRKLLIVEDHPEQAQLLERVIRLRFDMETSLVRDGLDGVTWARENLPDLILLDVMLYDINGFEVCRLLRADAQTVLTPIVMVTALNDAEHRLHGFQVGVNAFLTKPFSLDALFTAVESAWAWRARMEREPREGRLTIQPENQITLLQDLNDLSVRLRCSTPYTSEQVTQLCQFVHDLAQFATVWGLRENVVHPLHITYGIDYRAFTLTARGHPGGPHLAPSQLALQSDVVGTKRAPGALEGVKTSSTFSEICSELVERGLVDEIKHYEADSVVHLTKSFTSHETGPPST